MNEMKSYVAELVRVYDALFADAKYTFPALEEGLVRDQASLLAAVEKNGIEVFVTHLPALGKHLDRCLDDGAWHNPGIMFAKTGSRGACVLPQLFRGLYSGIFDVCGKLKEDADVESIIFLRQFLYMAKKTKIQCSTEKVAASVQQLLDTDEVVPHPTGFWNNLVLSTRKDFNYEHPGFAEWFKRRVRVHVDGAECLTDEQVAYVLGTQCEFDSDGDVVLSNQLQHLLDLIDQVASQVVTALGPYDPDEWSFSHGPGAVSDLEKFTNRYGAIRHGWTPELEVAFPLSRYAYSSYACWADDCDVCQGVRRAYCSKDQCCQSTVSSRSPSATSKLHAVPKNFKTPRLIAAEPAAKMWCQQNIWRYFQSRVQSSWLNLFCSFNDQKRNQQLCLLGSWDGRLVTLDLSEASDRVSCPVVGNLFRQNYRLCEALSATRTRFLDLNGVGGHDGLLRLNKFSMMGSACTFPVESLVFLTLCLAGCLWTRGMKAKVKSIKTLKGFVSVFGDDIVVPDDCRAGVLAALTLGGFVVNANKSYHGRNFRESCGVDSFAGNDVTPAYWKQPFARTPDSCSSTLDTADNFYKKFMVNVSRYLGSTITGFGKIPVVKMESGVAGLKSFVDPGPPAARLRWNSTLQRTEVCVPMPIATARQTPICDDSALLQFFTEYQEPGLLPWSSGVALRPVLKIRRRWVPLSDITYVG